MDWRPRPSLLARVLEVLVAGVRLKRPTFAHIMQLRAKPDRTVCDPAREGTAGSLPQTGIEYEGERFETAPTCLTNNVMGLYSRTETVWRPQRDSNPCFGLERATSWASGRWGLGRSAAVSGSPD